MIWHWYSWTWIASSRSSRSSTNRTQCLTLLRGGKGSES